MVDPEYEYVWLRTHHRSDTAHVFHDYTRSSSGGPFLSVTSICGERRDDRMKIVADLYKNRVCLRCSRNLEKAQRRRREHEESKRLYGVTSEPPMENVYRLRYGMNYGLTLSTKPRVDALVRVWRAESLDHLQIVVADRDAGGASAPSLAHLEIWFSGWLNGWLACRATTGRITPRRARSRP